MKPPVPQAGSCMVMPGSGRTHSTIAFKTNTNFIDVRLQKTQIKIWLNLTYGTLNDPKQVARDMSNIGHWSNGEYEIIMKINANMSYVMDLVTQSYRIHSS